MNGPTNLQGFGSGARPAAHLPASGSILDGLYRKDYLSELLTDVNTLLRLVPSPFTATMIAMEIPAAIRPYSMAVAPFWSDRKSRNFCFNVASN